MSTDSLKEARDSVVLGRMRLCLLRMSIRRVDREVVKDRDDGVLGERTMKCDPISTWAGSVLPRR